MNLTDAAEVLRTFTTDPEFDSLDPSVRRAIHRLLAAHPPAKASKPIPRLFSPQDAAWSKAIKRDAHQCAICEKPKDPAELEAMHCVSRGHRDLRSGFTTHSILGGCCLSHDRRNGAPGCHACHRAIDYNGTASEVFWRRWFAKLGYPSDHYDRLQEEAHRCSKILPRRTA